MTCVPVHRDTVRNKFHDHQHYEAYLDLGHEYPRQTWVIQGLVPRGEPGCKELLPREFKQISLRNG